MLALLVSMISDEVWTILGWLELVFMKKVHVGFRTRRFVFLIVDDFDTLKA